MSALRCTSEERTYLRELARRQAYYAALPVMETRRRMWFDLNTGVSVDEVLDQEAWAAHIRETLEATRGVSVEFIVRDVYTVHHNLENARRAVEIARREVDRTHGPLK